VDRIGRYQILGEIGRGAMGIVYRAQDPAIGRIIAVKTIRLDELTSPEERDRLKDRLVREAQSAGILSHPNIVTIYDILEENGQACIFMEYVSGAPLEKFLSGPEMPNKATLLNFLRQTATALDYAHRKGIVHRDIKPANIMIHDDEQAKITDFGVAKILSHEMTHSGTVMGTPNYMSPEQVQGATVDGRADQFALGVIAYEILTGEKPFAAVSLASLLYKIMREEPMAPQRLNPTLTPGVEQVLRKALAKDPQERFWTCTEFIAALSAALDEAPNWKPLPRGTAQNLPTFAENTAPRAATLPLDPPAMSQSQPVKPPVAIPPPPVLDSFVEERPVEVPERSPLVRNLIWVLVGIGLVGVVLLGAQKFLFNSTAAPTESSANSSENNGQKTAEAFYSGPPFALGDIVQRVGVIPEARLITAINRRGLAFAPSAADLDKLREAGAGASLINTISAKVESAKPSPLGQSEAPAKAESAQPAPPPPPPTSHPQESRPSAPPKQGEQTVQMVTEPPGANVVVDGNASLTCKTPCMLSLPPGRHTLSTELDGYRPYPRVLNVPQDNDVFLRLDKMGGTLSLTSNPPGASIEINGEAKSQKTPSSFKLSPGNYHVKVTRNGLSMEFDVPMHDGDFKTYNPEFK
jgi:serine/threonine-protein kinase